MRKLTLFLIFFVVGTILLKSRKQQPEKEPQVMKEKEPTWRSLDPLASFRRVF
jgi:uncharacterized membrane protein